MGPPPEAFVTTKSVRDEKSDARIDSLSSEAGQKIASDHDDVAPESLLSLAKDARYIRQCQALLEQIWGSSLGGSGLPSEQDASQRRTWLLSYLLYLLLVVVPSGKVITVFGLIPGSSSPAVHREGSSCRKPASPRIA